MSCGEGEPRRLLALIPRGSPHRPVSPVPLVCVCVGGSTSSPRREERHPPLRGSPEAVAPLLSVWPRMVVRTQLSAGHRTVGEAKGHVRDWGTPGLNKEHSSPGPHLLGYLVLKVVLAQVRDSVARRSHGSEPLPRMEAITRYSCFAPPWPAPLGATSPPLPTGSPGSPAAWPTMEANLRSPPALK